MSEVVTDAMVDAFNAAYSKRWADGASVSECRKYALTAVLAALSAAPDPWVPVETAKRDGTPYLMALKNPIPEPAETYRAWDGRYAACQHDGVTSSGFDRGWRLCGPLGYMGIPDDWFDACMPIAPRARHGKVER